MIKLSRCVELLTLIFSFHLILSSCNDTGKEKSEEEEVLMIMGDSILTMRDVEKKIPVGISQEDSAYLFRKITSNWIENLVLGEMAAEKLPDIEEIEQKVKDYRNRLIISEYLSRIRAKSSVKVSEDSIRKFYDLHKEEMLAERPLIKGLLLKVSESEDNLDDIRRCVFSATESSLDELERKWSNKVLLFDFFAETWVDWQKVSEQIPYRFYDPDAFLSSTKNFETKNGGIIYLLHVSDFIPTGKELPYEFSSSRIKAMLEQAKIARFQDDLVESLIRRSISEGKLKLVGYDPLRHKRLDKE